MNDFLQSIRNGQKDKRYNKNRRYYDGNNDYNQANNDRRNGSEKRNRNSRSGFQNDGLNHETLSAIKALLTELAETQKKNLEVESRRALAEERKADVLETVAGYLKDMVDLVPMLLPENQTAISYEKESDVEMPSCLPLDSNTEGEALSTLTESRITSSDTQSVIGRDEIVKTIRDMRDKGVTYEFIAQQLTQKNIPTFSGRGEWHAQTIHRLCQKK